LEIPPSCIGKKEPASWNQVENAANENTRKLPMGYRNVRKGTARDGLRSVAEGKKTGARCRGRQKKTPERGGMVQRKKDEDRNLQALP